MPTLDGMDYERLFAIVMGASLAANALTVAFMWAAKKMNSHEKDGEEPETAPPIVLILLIAVPLIGALGAYLAIAD